MNRRIGFIAFALLALVLLLGFAGTSRRDSSSPPPETSATPASAVAARGAPDAATADLEQPRHPEVGFRGRERLNEHFRKHGREFHVKSAAEYLRLAQLLRDRPKGGDVLEFVRNDAVTCRFDRATGAFLAFHSDGTIRTFFRPTTGEKYFDRQKSRAHENP